MKIDRFPEADFAGMYEHEVMDNPFCIKSSNENVIMVTNCPIMRQSKLQSDTALSTMEADIETIAHNCCKLFPIMDGVSIMGKVIGLFVCGTTIQVLIHQKC